MGTRSITTIIDNMFGEKPTKLCTMYRQYDGYPSGHGKELHAFLSTLALCNGLGGDPPEGKVWANGAGCLAAQMVRHFKQNVEDTARQTEKIIKSGRTAFSCAGGIYMTAPRTKLDGEDYGYEVTFNEDMTLSVVVRGYIRKIFEGNLEAFGVFCNKEGG